MIAKEDDVSIYEYDKLSSLEYPLNQNFVNGNSQHPINSEEMKLSIGVVLDRRYRSYFPITVLLIMFVIGIISVIGICIIFLRGIPSNERELLVALVFLAIFCLYFGGGAIPAWRYIIFPAKSVERYYAKMVKNRNVTTGRVAGKFAVGGGMTQIVLTYQFDKKVKEEITNSSYFLRGKIDKLVGEEVIVLVFEDDLACIL